MGDTLSELLHAKCSQGSWGDGALGWRWRAPRLRPAGIWRDVLRGKDYPLSARLCVLPAGQGEVGTGQGDGTFSLDPAVLLKVKGTPCYTIESSDSINVLVGTLSAGSSGNPIQHPQSNRGAKPGRGSTHRYGMHGGSTSERAAR